MIINVFANNQCKYWDLAAEGENSYKVKLLSFM